MHMKDPALHAGTTEARLAPHWRHVGAFLGLTFSLTWLLDLAIYLRGGVGTPGMVTIAPLPAPPGLGPETFLILAAVQSVLLGPILGIIITFGDEYGWWGYLQQSGPTAARRGVDDALYHRSRRRPRLRRAPVRQCSAGGLHARAQ